MKQIEFIDATNLARVLTIWNQLLFITSDEELRANPTIRHKELKQLNKLISKWRSKLNDVIETPDAIE